MYSITPNKKFGPLLTTQNFKDVKDPCPVFDGQKFHKYGSGGNVDSEKWQILHAISSLPEGPWIEEPTILEGVNGDHVAAPGVVFDNSDKKFHMFVQTEFMSTGGSVEYLTSEDGLRFIRQDSALLSLPGTDEAGIYDPHPAVISNEKYLVYAATKEVSRNGRVLMQPNIFLAKSTSGLWSGPWKRVGKILDHNEISWHHNDYNHPEYEWGIEGPQLIQLPSGQIILNAVSFLPVGEFTTRQRVFFALAKDVMGPYKTIGPILDPSTDEWGSGENGHAAAIIYEDKLHLYYQGRPKFNPQVEQASWQYGLAVYDINELQNSLEKVVDLVK